MSQANELLDSITDDELATYIAEPSDEPHIVIDSNRRITVPEQLKRIAVQYDHNVETVTFDCPRYWDGIDLSTMRIYINYMLPNGNTGGALATNISIDETDDSIMHFNWTITGDVTEYKGKLSILVCTKETGSDGDNKKHWNTELNTDMYISAGLDCVEPILQAYPDIITQLLVRMESVNAIATPEAMEEYVKDYFADVDSIIFVGGDSESTTDIVADFDIDNEVRDDSDNPVQNKVVKAYIDESINTISARISKVSTDLIGTNADVSANAQGIADINENISEINTAVSANNNEIGALKSGAEKTNKNISDLTEELRGCTLSLEQAIVNAIITAKLEAHPIGSYYWSADDTDPSLLFGGKWWQVKDMFVLAAGDTYTAGATGGAATVTLKKSQLPKIEGVIANYVTQSSDGAVGTGVFSKRDPGDEPSMRYGGGTETTVSGSRTDELLMSFGNNEAHDNMPPYIVAYCWLRTA